MVTTGNQLKIDIIFDCFINIYESLDKLMKTSLGYEYKHLSTFVKN